MRMSWTIVYHGACALVHAAIWKTPGNTGLPGDVWLVSLTGFEPAAFCSGGRRSNPLS